MRIDNTKTKVSRASWTLSEKLYPHGNLDHEAQVKYPETLEGLEFVTRLRHAYLPNSPDAKDDQFLTTDGQRFTLEDPCSKAMLQRMLEVEASAPSLAELKDVAQAAGHRGPDVEKVLLALIARGLTDPLLPLSK